MGELDMLNDTREIYEAVLGKVRKEFSELVVKYDRRIIALEEEIIDLKKNIEKIKLIYDSGKEKTRENTTYIYDKVDMNRYDIKTFGFMFNGWVYYANEEMGNLLYKVRNDGIDNQQLTEYSVCKTGYKVKNGKLHFRDSDNKERIIDL